MTTATLIQAPSPFRSGQQESIADTPWDGAAGYDAQAADSPSDAGADLSDAFIGRLFKFVEWSPGWDGAGAEHVAHGTAEKALKTARRMRGIAPEPFVAPAPTGSLLLQWDFADGVSVEVYVDSEEDFPAWAAVARGGNVHEVELSGLASLEALLRKCAADYRSLAVTRHEQTLSARDDENALRLVLGIWVNDGRLTSAAFITRGPTSPNYVPISLFIEERLPGSNGDLLHAGDFSSRGRARLSVGMIRSASYVANGVEVLADSICYWTAQPIPHWRHSERLTPNSKGRHNARLQPRRSLKPSTSTGSWRRRPTKDVRLPERV